jgi:protein involved in polysaccharide export with SLBB domain
MGAVCFLFLCHAGFGQEFGEVGEGPSLSIEDPDRESQAAEMAGSKERDLSQSSGAPAMFGVVDDATYIVGPGDVFYVAFGTKNFDTPVGPDGNVIVASFPPILVGNKSLAEAKKILSEKLSRYYKAGGIYVTLSGAKKFQVSVTGAINQPGMYVATAGSRVSNVIQSAGGVSRQASHQVVLRHASGESEKVSLGAYYRDGNLSQNPYLSQGDQVFVAGIDYSAPFVYVQNEKGNRLVQLLPDDDLESLVARASDFEKAKDWDHVNIYKDGVFLEKITRSSGRVYSPKNGTTLEVRATQLYVFVGGTVITPGAIRYNPTFTALDYIAKAGITINTGNADRVTVIDAQGRAREINAKIETPKPGDHILVPRSYEAKTRDYVGLTASVSSLAVAIATFLVLLNQ